LVYYCIDSVVGYWCIDRVDSERQMNKPARRSKGCCVAIYCISGAGGYWCNYQNSDGWRALCCLFIIVGFVGFWAFDGLKWALHYCIIVRERMDLLPLF
jgi:hypothetical protein